MSPTELPEKPERKPWEVIKVPSWAWMTPAEERCRQLAKEEAPQRARLSILEGAGEPRESETDMAMLHAVKDAPKAESGISMAGVPQDVLRQCPPLVRNALSKMDVAHQDEFAQEYQRKSKSVLKAYLRIPMNSSSDSEVICPPIPI